MSNLLPAAGSIASADRWFGAIPSGRIAMIDARDVGDAGALILLDATLRKPIYRLTGSSAITMAEVAQAMSQTFGRTISYIPASEEKLREGYAARSVPDWLVDFALGIERAMEASRHAEVAAELAELTKAIPRTILDFLRDHSARYEKAT